MLKFYDAPEYLLKKEVSYYKGWLLVFCAAIMVQTLLFFYLDYRLTTLERGIDAVIASTAVQE